MDNTLGWIITVICGLLPAVAAVLLARRGQLSNIPAIAAVVGTFVVSLLVTYLVGKATIGAGWLTYVIVAVVAGAIVWPAFGNRVTSEITDATH